MQEKWRDKIIIRDPIPSDTMRVIFGAMIMRGESTEKGFEWLRKLDANTKEYAASPTLLMQKITRQEGLISLYNMPDAVVFKEQKNMPIGYIFPRSGTPVVIDGIAIVKGAPNEEEARKFYEFVTTEESLLHAAEKFYRLPVERTDLDKAKFPSWMRGEIKRMNVDWNLLRKNGNDWMNYWNNEIRGRNRN